METDIDIFKVRQVQWLGINSSPALSSRNTVDDCGTTVQKPWFLIRFPTKKNNSCVMVATEVQSGANGLRPCTVWLDSIPLKVCWVFKSEICRGRNLSIDPEGELL